MTDSKRTKQSKEERLDSESLTTLDIQLLKFQNTSLSNRLDFLKIDNQNILKELATAKVINQNFEALFNTFQSCWNTFIRRLEGIHNSLRKPAEQKLIPRASLLFEMMADFLNTYSRVGNQQETVKSIKTRSENFLKAVENLYKETLIEAFRHEEEALEVKDEDYMEMIRKLSNENRLLKQEIHLKPLENAEPVWIEQATFSEKMAALEEKCFEL